MFFSMYGHEGEQQYEQAFYSKNLRKSHKVRTFTFEKHGLPWNCPEWQACVMNKALTI